MNGLGDGVKGGCRNCGSLNWSAMRTQIDKGTFYDTCSDCPVPVQVSGVPDVYFDKPGTHHGICDSETGKEIFITSKSHKAYEMKKYGLRETGDRVHGSNGFDPISHRHAMESLRRPSPPTKEKRNG